MSWPEPPYWKRIGTPVAAVNSVAHASAGFRIPAAHITINSFGAALELVPVLTTGFAGARAPTKIKPAITRTIAIRAPSMRTIVVPLLQCRQLKDLASLSKCDAHSSRFYYGALTDCAFWIALDLKNPRTHFIQIHGQQPSVQRLAN